MKLTLRLLRHARHGFSLIELLVVISIIAMLAGIAMPVYQTVLLQGKMTSALNKAKQIGLALHVYANDHGGTFPGLRSAQGEAITTANDAYRELIPSYLDNEQLFAVPGSKTGPLADNNIGSASQVLARGENHWAYVAGLTNTSKSHWPLIVDHTDGSGNFTPDESALGGTWKGAKTVVVHVDSSGAIERLQGHGNRRYLARQGEPTANALATDYMGSEVRLLEPAQ